MSTKKNNKIPTIVECKDRQGYRMQFRYKTKLGDSKKKTIYGKSRNECKQKYAEFMEGIECGVDPDKNKVTIPQILRERYKEDYELGYVKESTYNRNLDTIKEIEKYLIGRIPIADITKDHITEFLISIRPYSQSVISKLHSAVRKAFDLALFDDVIYKSPFNREKHKAPVSLKEKVESKPLTIEDQVKFVEALAEYEGKTGTNNHKLELLLELMSGLRMGEILGLREEDIDFENEIIHVKRTITRGLDYECMISESGKTRSAERDVPMVEEAKIILERAIEISEPNRDDLIFYDHKQSRPITTQMVNSFYKRFCTKHGVEHKSQHQLRKSFATNMWQNKIDVNTLRIILGHTSVNMTAKIYAIPDNKYNRNEVLKAHEKISAAFKGLISNF